MSKVKVWGKEVEDCVYCNYCSSYEPRCIIGKFNLYDGYELGHRDDIHKDCPFSKSVTKEVIESFGFEYIKTHPGTTESYFELPNSEWGIDFDPDWNSKPFIRIYVFGCDGDTTHFSGIINNPVELEFIFKSIGVIK